MSTSSFKKPFFDNLKEGNWPQILILVLACAVVSLVSAVVYMFFLINSNQASKEIAVKAAVDETKGYYEPIVGVLRYKVDSMVIDKIESQALRIEQIQTLNEVSAKQKKETEAVKSDVETLKQKSTRNRNVIKQLENQRQK